MARKPKQPISPDIQEQISRAIEQIPKLVSTPDPVEPQQEAPRFRLPAPAQDEAKKRLLFLCVPCIAAVILVMWAWNFRMLWYATDFSETKKDWTINEVKDDVSALLSEQEALLKTTTTPRTAPAATSPTSSQPLISDEMLRTFAASLSQTSSTVSSTQPTTTTNETATTTSTITNN